jgi:hypothetical protein
MGSASSIVKAEMAKPLDASDVTDVAAAKAEVMRYRSLLKQQYAPVLKKELVPLKVMEKVQGDRVMGLDASKYRVRCVSYGLPEDGFAAGMAATIPYFSSPDPMMPEGVAKEVFLTTADETKQFILLFYEAKAEETIMAQYGKTPADDSWKAMEAGAKEAGMMADPVQFTYMDASTLYGDVKEIMIPAVASAMPKLAGWPADYPSIEGAIVQTDAPVSAKGAYEGVKYNPKFAPNPT